MKTLNELKEEMSQFGLDAYFDALAPMAKNSIQIKLDVQDDDDIPVGVSKFGGCPDLPAGVEWFRKKTPDRPLSFLAQINLAEAAPYDLDHKLPKNGMLYFFYDCSIDGMPWEYDPEDPDGWKVYFYEGDPASLSRREALDELDGYEIGILFGSARMIFDAEVELARPESDLMDIIDLPDDEELQDRYWDWMYDDKDDFTFINKLLGHADPVQNGMEAECEYVINGLYYNTPDRYNVGRSKGLNNNVAHWNLLMQIDSNEEEIGMMWGDMGKLYLWITDEDLAARKFENTLLVLQCG